MTILYSIEPNNTIYDSAPCSSDTCKKSSCQLRHETLDVLILRQMYID